ncbi:BatA domain-containing protein [Reichenbachiella versicolor]|uniref:BatA domain-containing protein n=1 Tax=Reichenbachiella versicolor TaxID=1821036 RepID=UPI000D6E27B6|nr:BatA domain-containing protein [Reichenbachiella versicolor]
MQFMYPSFLWALLLMTIPVIIHLFNFRKPKLVIFSNVRFLKSVQKKNASNQRLKHLLIMAARMLFIAFAVLTFAQPFIPSNEEGISGTHVDIYLDNSPSMSNKVGDKTGITQSVLLVSQLLELYPDAAKFRLITNEFAPKSNHYRSKEQITELMYDLSETNQDRSFEQIMKKIKDSEIDQKDVFIVSDYQLSTKRNLEITDSLSKYYLLPVRFDQYNNVSVDSVYLRSPFVIPGQRNQVIASLTNHGSNSIIDLHIKLFINQNISSGASIDIDAGETVTIEFELDKKLEPTNVCQLSIEDYPITFDNQYHFIINTLNGINISEVKDGSESSRFEKVFSSNELFNYSGFSSNKVNYESIKNSDLVILNELQNIDKGLSGVVASMYAEGKTIVFIPNEKSTSLEYLVPLGIGYDQLDEPQEGTVKTPDIDHPFFVNIFEKVDKRNKMPSCKILLSYFNSTDVILSSQLGTPFLSLFENKGSLYAFSAPISNSHSTLTENALFVPLMHRIAERSSLVNQSLAYSTDQDIISMTLDSINKKELYKLVNHNAQLVPSQRTASNRLILEVPTDLIKTGIYELKNQQKSVSKLAFNHPKVESDLIPYTEDQLKALAGSQNNIELFEFSDESEFGRDLKEKYLHQDLWKYALILCLVFLTVETLLIRFL